jgi:hypothetical protein
MFLRPRQLHCSCFVSNGHLEGLDPHKLRCCSARPGMFTVCARGLTHPLIKHFQEIVEKFSSRSESLRVPAVRSECSDELWKPLRRSRKI